MTCTPMACTNAQLWPMILVEKIGPKRKNVGCPSVDNVPIARFIDVPDVGTVPELSRMTCR